jgi:steroid delta-isomerase-like uncharacterized protein
VFELDAEHGNSLKGLQHLERSTSMSTEDNKAIARRIFEEVGSQGNFAVIDEAVSPNFVYRTSAFPEFHGPGGFKEFFTEHRKTLPDIHYTVEDMIAEGDKVVARWTATGTHKGDMMGIPPTGKQATVTGITTFRFANGKMVEGLTTWDALGMMQQLGLIPAPGQAS